MKKEEITVTIYIILLLVFDFTYLAAITFASWILGKIMTKIMK